MQKRVLKEIKDFIQFFKGLIPHRIKSKRYIKFELENDNARLIFLPSTNKDSLTKECNLEIEFDYYLFYIFKFPRSFKQNWKLKIIQDGSEKSKLLENMFNYYLSSSEMTNKKDNVHNIFDDISLLFLSQDYHTQIRTVEFFIFDWGGINGRYENRKYERVVNVRSHSNRVPYYISKRIK